ncbi:MAG: leucine-rich repeat protein, partial [Clostridia bacterium]|nr:leucine-rich repeat protein [Clostridia bacterium]
MTSIGDSAFYACSGLTSVTLPEGVTSIGYQVFGNCSGLTSVTLPAGMTSIGDSAFHSCSSLTSVTLPEGMTSIGDSAFHSCSSLTSVTLPEGMTSIGDSAFYACSGLTSVTIPEGVTSIGDSAFHSCSSLTSVTLPEGMTSIGDSAFYACSGLTSVTLPEGVTSIGYQVFGNCSGLTSVTLPDSVTGIGSSAFQECTKLSEVFFIGTREAWNSITIGDGNECLTGASIACIIARGTCGAEGSSLTWVLSVDGVLTISGDGAMQDYQNGASPWYAYRSAVTSVVFQGNLTHIGSYAFSDCTGLSDVLFIGSREAWNSITIGSGNECLTGAAITIREIIDSGTCGDGLTWTLDDAGTLTISGSGYMEGYSIDYIDGADITTAPWGTNVRNIVFAGNVYSIGGSAFCGNKGLTSVTIPASVNDVSWGAFYGCTGLTSVTMEEGVTDIHGSAFLGCTALTQVTLSKSVESIGTEAFRGCSSLTDLRVDPANPYYASQGGALFNRDMTCLVCAPAAQGVYRVPDGVVSIGDAAFIDCTKMTGVLLPDTVTGIGESAFMICEGLTGISLPEGVTEIGRQAFSDCSHLQGITIPEGVTVLEYGVFNNCESLEDITLPAGLTRIGDSAFANCAMADITIPEGVTYIGGNAFYGCMQLKELRIPDSVTSLGGAPFMDCWHLTDITLPARLTRIPESCFSGCALTGITIPESVTDIDAYAFSYCRRLTAVTIPAGVTSIGEHAFDTCTRLESVMFLGTTTTFGEAVCSNTPTVYCYEYSDADYWAGEHDYPIVYLDGLDPDSVRTISIPDGDFSLYLGQTRALSPVVFPTHDQPVVSWVSSDPAVAGIGEDGTVTAVGEGSAVITASVGSVSAGITVTVIDPDTVRTVTLPDRLDLVPGDTARLIPEISPDYDHPAVTWSSSDPGVASVDADGTVTGMAAGTASITATVGSASATAVVRVYIPMTDFAFSQSEYWVITKRSEEIHAVFIPEGASGVLTLSSSDTAVAAITATASVSDPETYIGTMLAKRPGDAVLTAASESGLVRTAAVHVCYPVTAVSLSAPETDVLVGGELPVTAAVTMGSQSCVNHLVTFTSSDETVATVDAEGVVHGMSAGTAVITAAAVNDGTISSSVTVTVRGPRVLTLPESLVRLDSEALAGLENVDIIVIPAGVTSIADDAFAGTGAVLSVAAGSPAETWAADHEFDYIVR